MRRRMLTPLVGCVMRWYPAPIPLRVLAIGLTTLAPMKARAQSIEDGSDAAIGAANARTVVQLVGLHLKSTDAKITALRRSGDTAICGSVDVRNRMGAYTGPRGFVADLSDGFIGRLPEGPELRNPASVADFRAMERAKALFAQNCAR